MIELWRRWSWRRYERRTSVSDNFAEFQRLFSGPITPDLAYKMPLSVLLERRNGEIALETRNTIDAEITRRLNSRQPLVANVLAVIAVIISLVALAKTR